MEFFNWRKDACVENECEITPREEELERKKHANATAEQKSIENLQAWVEEEEKRKRKGGRTMEERSAAS